MCPPGHFADKTGSFKCKTCSKSTLSLSGSSTCYSAWKIQGSGFVLHLDTSSGSPTMTSSGSVYGIVQEILSGNDDTNDHHTFSVQFQDSSNGQFLDVSDDGSIILSTTSPGLNWIVTVDDSDGTATIQSSSTTSLFLSSNLDTFNIGIYPSVSGGVILPRPLIGSTETFYLIPVTD